MNDRKKLENKLDKLWRTIGKEKAYCEICATLPKEERTNTTVLQPHHIIKRGHKATRWDLQNRLWVCFTHHTGSRKGVEYNEAGWFWGAENDWLGRYRSEDKKHLAKLKKVTKKWTIDELQGLINKLSK